MDNNIVLKMEKICKYYPGVTALDHVDFELRKGEVHALLGENGAGKSTLCKIIAGAQPMDDGSYCLDGEQIRTLTPQSAKDKGVSMIYQEFNLVPYLKVYENMFLGKEIERGIYADKRAMIRKTREVFERFHIEIDPNSRISDLSNAYKQQVEIAKAVLENAKVLIMDEPTAPLGNREVENLFEMIRTLKSEGVSIIYISHRLEELFEISDRITVMRDGQYIETLNTKDTNKSALVKLMVGRDLSEDYPQRSTPIGEEVLRVEHLSTVETKLHDVSFTLHKGEILGFAGLVGAGRTETARAIFGIDPKVAVLSFSTKGSGKGGTVALSHDAVIKAQEMAPELAIDGELQFDAAVAPEVAQVKCKGSKVAGQANTFIFPCIEAGNIGYKIAQRLGGYAAYGPILQGLNAPINDLSRGCNADEVYKMSLITACQS